MKKIILVLFITTSLVIFTSISSATTKKLIFPTITTSPLNDSSMLILKTAYKKIGYEVEFTPVTAKRSLLESSTGSFDGEIHRIKGIEKIYPNLIMIKVPINHFELRALSLKYNFYIDNKDKLKGYKIGIQGGILLTEEYSRDLNAETVNNELLNFRKLKAGRIDFILLTDVSAVFYLKNPEFNDIKILEPPLQTVNLYHYLHKKNAHLIPKLTEVLQEMKDSGVLQQIRNDTLNK